MKFVEKYWLAIKYPNVIIGGRENADHRYQLLFLKQTHKN